MIRHSFPKDKIKVLLLEGVHASTEEHFRENGYNNVIRLKEALDGEDLINELSSAHIVGIRSRTQLTADILAQAPRLFCVGCFCIGTNQVDLQAARLAGIPVFNAPHSNTRSVAELVIAEMIMLYRGVGDKNMLTHQGKWQKSASNAHEIRGRTLGIVGYGHIGMQVSILAEAMGLNVVYHDLIPRLPLGNAEQVSSLDELLEKSDVISLHVPETPLTKGMINAETIAKMKKGVVVVNASRGSVVDLNALSAAIRDNHVMGAAVDVFPDEPATNEELFKSPLQGLPNVILTPHIGGSTVEAQRNIGYEVARKLVQHSDLGSTNGAVNFPNIALTPHEGRHRLLHAHHNQPGVLSEINKILADAKANVLGQSLETTPDVGYVVIDVDREHGPLLKNQLKSVKGTIRCRVLY